MNRELVADYRLAREAQLERFEARVQGRDRSDRGSPEWCEYFGVGEYSGGGVEPLLTFKSWLVAAKRERQAAEAAAPAEAPVWDSWVLDRRALDGLVSAGDGNAAAELVRRPPAVESDGHEYRRFLVWDDGLCRHLLVTFRRPSEGGEWVPVPHPSQARIAASRERRPA